MVVVTDPRDAGEVDRVVEWQTIGRDLQRAGHRDRGGPAVTASAPSPRRFFSFPDPVNEVSVRITAAGVALLALTAVVLRRPEPLIVLAYGFLARAAAGPRLSPLALLSTRVITPRLGLSPRPVPG